MQLRPYQQRAIDQLWQWMGANDGHPCMVLPTGSGKSIIVAEVCRYLLQNWPETRVLMLTHQRELIAQNAEKLRAAWPGAPLGICSAGLGSRELGEPITFAGIQSLRGKARDIGHTDIVIIDECHLISTEESGTYRVLLAELAQVNPLMRVVGLTATPYRLGHGMLTDGDDALFTAILEPVSIEELVTLGFLAPLRSKLTGHTYDITGVHKRGGEYVESEIQAAVDTEEQNARVAREIIERAGNRRSWLLFCSGVHHAEAMASELLSRGILAACVTGETPVARRDELLRAFKAGKLTALTNANVLTTGFDAPDTDLVAMLRPTMSPGLYVQMVGRGCRLKSHTDHCLVLDFAGNVQRHGPITAVQPPGKQKRGTGDAPVKICEQCQELCPLSARECPACGEPFPEVEKPRLELREDDIMGLEGLTMACSEWQWRVHTGRSSGAEMLRVDYYGEGIGAEKVSEFLVTEHDGWAGEKARRLLGQIVHGAGGVLPREELTLDEQARFLSALPAPTKVDYRRDGKFFRVTGREWGKRETPSGDDLPF